MKLGIEELVSLPQHRQNRTKVGLKHDLCNHDNLTCFGQNRTKVGLKLQIEDPEPIVFIQAKSNQGGIETIKSYWKRRVSFLAKSNQGGIETLMPRKARTGSSWGQNRTKVGLKQEDCVNLHAAMVRQNRAKVGLKPTRGPVGQSLVTQAKSNQGGIETTYPLLSVVDLKSGKIEPRWD